MNLSIFSDGVAQQSSALVDSAVGAGQAAAAGQAQEVAEVEIPPYFYDRVTRPYLNEYATLAIKTEDGSVLAATDHFLLGMIMENDQERTSARFSQGAPSLYVGAGRMPRLYSYSGFLVDSISSGPGITMWLDLYDRFLRGTKCVENKAIAELSTRDFRRVGYITSCNVSMEASRPQVATLSFVLFVIAEKNR